MGKEEALELLMKSPHMEPADANGDPVIRIVGEYGETELTYNWGERK